MFPAVKYRKKNMKFWRKTTENHTYLIGKVRVLTWQSTCTYLDKYVYLFEGLSVESFRSTSACAF